MPHFKFSLQRLPASEKLFRISSRKDVPVENTKGLFNMNQICFSFGNKNWDHKEIENIRNSAVI